MIDANIIALFEMSVIYLLKYLFTIPGIASHLRCRLGYFASKGVTAYQIMPTFFEAVAILELTYILPVIATARNGASHNFKLY